MAIKDNFSFLLLISLSKDATLKSTISNKYSINSSKDYRYDMEKDKNELMMSYLSPIDEVSEAKISNITKLLTEEENPESKHHYYCSERRSLGACPWKKTKNSKIL